MAATEGNDYGRVTCIVAMGILVIALALRAWGLGDSLWLDEIISVDMANKSFSERLEALKSWDPHPPLFYTALDLTSPRVASELRLRLLPFACGLLYVLVLGWVAGMLWGQRAAVAAAALAAVAWELVWVSHELRSFALANLTTGIAWGGTIRWLRGGKPMWLVAVGLAGAAALYTFYYAAVPLVALAVFVVAMRPPDRRGWLWLVSPIVALVLFSPWVPTFLIQFRSVAERTATGYGTTSVNGFSWALDALRMHLLKLGLYATLAVGGLAIAALIGRKSGHMHRVLANLWADRRLRAVALYGLTCIAVIVVGWAVGSFTNTLRYATFLTGIWAVFAAGCIANCPPRYGLMLLMVMVVAGGHRSLRHLARDRKEDWRSAVAALDNMAPPGETLVLVPPYRLCYQYYSNVARPDVRGGARVGDVDHLQQLLLSTDVDRLERIWVLWSNQPWGASQERSIRQLEHRGLAQAGSWDFRHLRITCHRRLDKVSQSRAQTAL